MAHDALTITTNKTKLNTNHNYAEKVFNDLVHFADTCGNVVSTSKISKL